VVGVASGQGGLDLGMRNDDIEPRGAVEDHNPMHVLPGAVIGPQAEAPAFDDLAHRM
jgi:hypothetical protein